MINDLLKDTFAGGTLDIDKALLGGPVNNTIGSPLLYDLWYNNVATINVQNNPVFGGVTGTQGTVNGVTTILVDTATFPNAPEVTINGVPSSKASTVDQLAERIGHELAHAELPDANDNYIDPTVASTLGQAIAIGERDEGEAYTAQYVIAEQLSDIGNNPTPDALNTSFYGLNKVFAALRAVAGQDSPFFSLINNQSELINSQFYQDAVGTLSALGKVSLATASLGSGVGSGAAFTQLDKWQDQWILANVYKLTGGTYSYNPKDLTHSSITVKSDGQGGWTFVGNNIPITLKNLALPDGTTVTGAATLSFKGSESTASINPGEYSISIASAKENLIYGGYGGPASYTLKGIKGTDWFFVNSPSGTVTITPYNSTGGVFINSTQIGGAATGQISAVANKNNQWLGSDGTTYTWDGKNTLVLTSTQWSGAVDITGFNQAALTAAESTQGFLGIFLQPIDTVTIKATNGSGSAQKTPNLVPNVDPATSAPNFVPGGSQAYTVSTDAPSNSAQTVTLTLSGVPSSDFAVDTGSGLVAVNTDGTFIVTIPAGQTSASFSLTNTGDIGQNATLQLSAVFQDPANGDTISGGTVTQNYVEPTADNPFSQPGTPTLYLVGTETTFQGLTFNLYSSQQVSQNPVNSVPNGNNLISVVGGSGQSIAGGTGNDTIHAIFGQVTTGGALTDGGVDVITGNGGQDIILAGSAATSITSPLSPAQVRIYAGSQVDIQTAIANANTGAPTGQQGDLVISDLPNATIIGGNGNDLILDSGNDLVVAGPGNETIVSGVFGVDSNLATYSGFSGLPEAGQTWSDSTNNANQILFSSNLYDYGVWNGTPAPGYEGNYDDFAAPFLATNATIFGGSGNDLIQLSNGNNEVELGTGRATVFGGMGNNTIYGGGGGNDIYGGGGSDYIDANDNGGTGSLIVGRGGNNTIFGGAGNDTIYAGGWDHNWQTEETGNNYVQAGSGNTVIDGSGGNDTLIGGSGRDTIQGGAGNEYIVGGTGNESINGGSGNETLIAGGDGTDTIWAGGGSTTIYGGGGTDYLHGGAGANLIYSGDGGTSGAPTQVDAGSGPTTIYGGDGVDSILGGGGTTLIYAGDGGTAGAPTQIVAGFGDTTVYGGAGLDYIAGGSGADLLYGGNGGTSSAPGLVTSGSGPDTLYGGFGDNVLEDSLSGQDLIVSQTGDDSLIGMGNDTLVAGTGDDSMEADGGSVTLVFNAGFGSDTIHSGGGTENLVFGTGMVPADFSASLAADSAGNVYVEFTGDGGDLAVEGALTGGNVGAIAFADSGQVSLDTLLTGALGADQVVPDSNNPENNLIVTVGNGESVTAGQYNDTLSSWGSNDTLAGGTNSNGDLIYSAGAAASIYSGTGNDTITAAGNDATVTGGSRGDRIAVSGANSLVTSTTGADSITASGTQDTLVGGAGNSTFYVNDASTVIEVAAGSGVDSIVSSVSYTAPSNVNVLTLAGTGNIAATGNAGNDTLYGGAAADTLIAGTGVDTLIGGSGNTTFVVDNTADVVQDNSTTSNNQIESSVSYSLATNVNTLVLTGTANLVGTANGANDTIVSNGGVDTLIGGSGNDIFIINNPGDVIEVGGGGSTGVVEASSNYSLQGSVFTLVLTGTAALVGTANSGNDTLISNSGADTLMGGAGNDVFVVNNANDVVQDTFANTSNTILSSVAYTLPTNVNALTLTGSAALVATGNSAADLITANAGNDTLVAGSGAATLIGGAGSDTFVIDSTADVVQDTATNGSNTIQASVSYSLAANANTLILGGANGLTGNANSGNDTLVADSNADTLMGGSGNETFIVNGVGDVVQDTSTSASNVIESAVSYTLPTDVNTLMLTGTGNNVGTSNSGNDSLVGDAGADTLVATSGLDTLVAGSGPATLEGGSGNDVFVVNNASDVVIAGTGTDTILSSASYVLPTGVQILQLTGTANITGTAISGNNLLSGNAGNDVLYAGAGAGADTLIAGAGADTLVGGGGADTFVIDSTADVIESVSSAAANQVLSSVSYTLPSTISILTLSGSANLLGAGNGGNDTLTANGGNDTLIGGGGVVDLVGGKGPDLFIVDNAADSVTGSSSGADTIESSISYTLPGTVNVLELSSTANLIAAGNTQADLIVGNGGNDTLFAGSGADTLVAGSGLATLVGSTGNDTFLVNNTADVVEDSSTGGSNTLISSVTYTLPTGVDTLLLTGTAALVGAANGDNDSIVGNGGADTLMAGSGNDTLTDGGGAVTMVAGSGNDTFVISNAADVIEGIAAGSNDVIVSSVSLVLPDSIAALTLTGAANIMGTVSSPDDVLTGGAGNDTLVAGADADTLIGGAGNTTFIVSSASDVVEDSQATATNTLEASMSYSLPTDVNVLVLTGSANLAGTANSGSDTLVSNSGVDTLYGGGGNDTFVVNNPGDVVEAGAQGTSDTVVTASGFTLVAGVNSLILTGSANVTGAANSGNDSLVSNSGADTLVGGSGNDTFIVNNAGDVVLDTSTSASNAIQASVSYSLPTNVNSLTLTKSSLVGTGNAGADTLVAGAGLDTLMAGTGNDLFVINNTSDVVQDGSTTANDTIQSSVSYSLPANVNTLVLTGASNATAIANSGTDTLVANRGIDTLVGGSGSDVFVLTNTADVVEFGSSYADTIESYASYTASSNISALTLLGTASLTGAVTGSNQVLTGNAGYDTLELASKSGTADTVYAGSGGGIIEDSYQIDDFLGGANLFVGGSGSVTFQTTGTDTLVAGTGSNIITPSSRASGTGLYYWDTLTLVLNSGFGNSYQYADQNGIVSYSQPDNLDFGPGITPSSISIAVVPDSTRTMSGYNATTDIQLTIGGSTLSIGDGFLPGRIGTVSFAGGSTLTFAQLLAQAQPISQTTTGGTLFSDVNGDSLTGGSGVDTLVGWGNNDTLTAGSDTQEYLYAGGSDDVLYGSSQYTNLYANGVADTLVAGSGGATFVVGDPSDVIVNAGGSTNIQLDSFANYTLPAGVDSLTLVGTAALVATGNADATQVSIQGNQGNDTLEAGPNSNPNSTYDIITGYYGNDVLIGGNGSNLLETQSQGNCTMIAGSGPTWEYTDPNAGTGDVFFIINSSSDSVTASSFSNDTLESSVSYTTPAGINTILLTGTADLTLLGYYGVNDYIVANSGNDELVGGSGMSTIVAGNGNDTFSGGAYVAIAGSGNDVFGVGNTADVIDLSAAHGNDTVEYGVPDSTFTLPAYVDTLEINTAHVLAFANSDNDSIASIGNNTLVAGSGQDTLNDLGYNGPDTLIGGSGSDLFIVNASGTVVQDTWTTSNNAVQSAVNFVLPTNVNTLTLTGTNSIIGTGNSANDLITANSANDTLVSGSGIDTLVGGSGADMFVLNNTGDVIENMSSGNNTVEAAFSYTLPASVAALILTGTADLTATANNGNDTLTSNAGTDTLVGGAGNDTFVVNNAADVISDTSSTAANTLYSSVSYSLPTNVNTLILTGTGNLVGLANTTGGDVLLANSGADTLISAVGLLDQLEGGTGSDLFEVNYVSDTVTVGKSHGIDTIQSSVSFSAAANVADLVFTGTAAVSGTGNSLANLIIANDGSDTLTAGSGLATLQGGAGNDVFVINNLNDVVIDTSTTSANTLRSSVSYTLPTNINALVLTGSAALSGTANNGADTLTSNTGLDTLTGGDGNDLFIVSKSTDIVQDTWTTTTNALQASVSFSLPTNVNALTFTGSTAVEGFGNAANDLMTANTGADTLVAGNGNDTLQAGTGTAADSLVGGTGNDLFIVNHSGDAVNVGTIHGNDTIEAYATYTAAPNVATLTMMGTSNLSGTGNSLANVITGNSGNDTLTAGAGLATLIGGTGSDTFVINNTADVVVESSTTSTNVLSSSVSYTLPTNVNRLILTGSASLVGSANNANDTLTANNSSDTLVSGTGIDSLVGGTGTDLFVVNNASDVVTVGATHGTDTIQSSVSFTASANVADLTLTGTAALVATGNSLANVLTANGGADTLVAGSGIATMIGGAGTDTFVVDSASDVISVSGGNSDVVRSSANYTLGANLSYLMLTGTGGLAATGNGSTDLIVGNTGSDTLSGGTGIAVLEGGTAGSDQIKATGNQAALIAGGGASTLTGGAFKDFLAAGLVSDSITTGATSNVIAVNKGDGATTLKVTTGATEILSLGAGIDTESLVFNKSGTNLVLTDGVTGDSIIFSGWYGGTADQTVSTLQVIEAASSSYNSSGTNSLQNQAVEDFNFASLVSQYNAAPSQTNWSLSQGMPTAKLSSSGNTAAYGGDLAYYFGLNGNLTGMNLSAVQSALTNSSFATGSQTIDTWSSISGNGGGLQLLAQQSTAGELSAGMPADSTTAPPTVSGSAASASSGTTAPSDSGSPASPGSGAAAPADSSTATTASSSTTATATDSEILAARLDRGVSRQIRPRSDTVMPPQASVGEIPVAYVTAAQVGWWAVDSSKDASLDMSGGSEAEHELSETDALLTGASEITRRRGVDGSGMRSAHERARAGVLLP
jgi:Ca2+-binding RTX toxin-like protein